MKEVPFVRIKSRILLCEHTRRFLKAVRNEIVTSRQPFDYDSEYSVTSEVITFKSWMEKRKGICCCLYCPGLHRKRLIMDFSLEMIG